MEEPPTPVLDVNGLSRGQDLVVVAQDDAKARVEDVAEEVFHDAVEDVNEAAREEDKAVRKEERAQKEEAAAKEEKKVAKEEDAVQNGADMSEYSSRRTSIRRAGSSRTEVEGELSERSGSSAENTDDNF